MRRGRFGALALALAVAAASAPTEAAPSQALTLSGSAQASVSGALGADYGSGPGFSYGAEEYANLRLRAKAGEGGVFYAALNLLAASGSAAAASLSPDSGFVVGEGYAAALELERLYFRLEGELFDADLGLQRLAFGFGQAFSPEDFLVSRNPLVADARPRGRLAAALTAYPSDFTRLQAFAVAPAEARNAAGEGALFGALAEAHGRRTSAQALYALELPRSGAPSGLHRAGLSLKLDAGAGIVLDALYSLDPAAADSGDYFGRDWAWWRGLEASLGLDYSLLGGKLYLLGQYLWNGPGLLAPGQGLEGLYGGTAWYERPPAARIADLAAGFSELNRRNYLYASASYRVDDYTSASLSCLASLDDLSFSPALGLEHEPFQGLGLAFQLRLPLDRANLGGGSYGELGPIHTGSAASLRATAKLKF